MTSTAIKAVMTGTAIMAVTTSTMTGTAMLPGKKLCQ